ncbi:MAG: hypothetical protein ACI4L8_02740 [Candidatus Fimadaptatus sp.]
MGLNGFTEWLFSALLSWMQIIYNWLWSMLASGGQNEFMPWFSDNWLKIVLILIIVGLVVDYTIYLMRWQPYHVWLTTLRRARGYVSRPFTREQPRMHYAGYRRVLEGCEGEEVGAGAAGAAGATGATGATGAARRRSAGTYEARPRTQRAAGTLEVRPVERAAAHPNTRPARPERSAYARRADGQRAYGNVAEEYAPVSAVHEDRRPAGVAAEEYASVNVARENERPAGVAAEGYAPVSAALADEPEGGMALDADGYVPETVSAPGEGEPLEFGEPPAFARSTRESAPVYGRAYQRPGQSFMPIGVESDTRPQVELPDMEGLDMLNGHDAAAEPERPARTQACAGAESLPGDTYETRRSARQAQAQRNARRYEGAVEPTGNARRYEGAVEPTGNARRYEGTVRPAERAAGAAGQTAPRTISVRETGITREIDFDDEID